MRCAARTILNVCCRSAAKRKVVVTVGIVSLARLALPGASCTGSATHPYVEFVSVGGTIKFSVGLGICSFVLGWLFRNGAICATFRELSRSRPSRMIAATNCDALVANRRPYSMAKSTANTRRVALPILEGQATRSAKIVLRYRCLILQLGKLSPCKPISATYALSPTAPILSLIGGVLVLLATGMRRLATFRQGLWRRRTSRWLNKGASAIRSRRSIAGFSDCCSIPPIWELLILASYANSSCGIPRLTRIRRTFQATSARAFMR